MSEQPMADKPDEAKRSRLWPYRQPIRLIAIGVAAALWLFGLADGYAAIFVMLFPVAAIDFYKMLYRTWHQTPQKWPRTNTDHTRNSSQE